MQLRRIDWIILACAFALLLFMSPRYPIQGDAMHACATADHYIFSGRALSSKLPAEFEINNKYSLVYVLSCVPGLLSTVVLDDYVSREVLLSFTFSFWLAITSILLGIGFILVLRLLACSYERSLISALLLIFCTPLLFYARVAYSEIFQACILIWAYYYWLQVLNPENPKIVSASSKLGTLLALLVGLKVIYIYILIVFFLGLRFYLPFDRQVKIVIAKLVLLPVFVMCLVLLGYNYLRYDEFLNFGYDGSRDGSLGFSTSIFTGLFGLLVSPGKGIIWFCPLLLLLFQVYKNFSEFMYHRMLEILAISVPLILIYSRWWAWHGDWSWGPRFLIVLLPFLFIPIAFIEFNSIVTRVSFIVFSLIGFLINYMAVLISPMIYFELLYPRFAKLFQIRESIPNDMLLIHFVPEFSQINAQLWLIKCQLFGGLSCSSSIPGRYYKLPFLSDNFLNLVITWDPICFAWVPWIVIPFSALLLGALVYLILKFMNSRAYRIE